MKVSRETWRPVVFAADLPVCDCCEEPYCPKCLEHYWECDCPGPHQDDEYDYQEINGQLMARRKA